MSLYMICDLYISGDLQPTKISPLILGAITAICWLVNSRRRCGPYERSHFCHKHTYVTCIPTSVGLLDCNKYQLPLYTSKHHVLQCRENMERTQHEFVEQIVEAGRTRKDSSRPFIPRTVGLEFLDQSSNGEVLGLDEGFECDRWRAVL